MLLRNYTDWSNVPIVNRVNSNVMRKTKIAVMMVMCVQGLQAQTWNEWFAQKKTQIKYLFEQVAALQTYTGYLKEGYSIVSNGINTINDIKHGDFDLHSDHFNSLKQVNPSIKNLSQVEGITSYQTMIVKQFKQCIASCNESDQFTDDEMNYINGVYNYIISECLKNIDALTLLGTNGDLEMKDDERLERINQIYLDMQDKYSFTMSFTKQASILAASRTKEANDINTSKTLYNIK